MNKPISILFTILSIYNLNIYSEIPEEMPLKFKVNNYAYLKIKQDGQETAPQPRETLFQTINGIILHKVAPDVIPKLTFYVIEYMRSSACAWIASFIPTYRVINSDTVKINSRDFARILLEGGSVGVTHSLIFGSRDENDDFKLRWDKEILADSVNASVKYALLSHVAMPFVRKKLNDIYPQNAEKKEKYEKWIGYSIVAGYDGSYQSLRRYFSQR